MRSLSLFHMAIAFAALMTLTEAMPPREEIERLLNVLQLYDTSDPRSEEYDYNIQNGGPNLRRQTPLTNADFIENAKPPHRFIPRTMGHYSKKSQEDHVNFDEIDHSSLPFYRGGRGNV